MAAVRHAFFAFCSGCLAHVMLSKFCLFENMCMMLKSSIIILTGCLKLS